jgi:hypothetical protein
MWLNVETWKKFAEDCNSNLKKGAQIEIKRRLVQDHNPFPYDVLDTAPAHRDGQNFPVAGQMNF